MMRQELIMAIDALAEEAQQAGERCAAAVLFALVGAMKAREEIGLMEHVGAFSWRLLCRMKASSN